MSGKSIALISAQWHEALVQIATQSCVQTLTQRGMGTGTIDQFTVPGSLEIPLFAQKAIQTNKYQAVIAFGWVVDGGIYRHDFVAHAILQGLMRVQLDTGVPVFSCILTPQVFHDHQEHRDFFSQHLVSKGEEVASSCLKFFQALEFLK